jgi:hypothetical protein
MILDGTEASRLAPSESQAPHAARSVAKGLERKRNSIHHMGAPLHCSALIKLFWNETQMVADASKQREPV